MGVAILINIIADIDGTEIDAAAACLGQEIF